jgi:hypothetical protein
MEHIDISCNVIVQLVATCDDNLTICLSHVGILWLCELTGSVTMAAMWCDVSILMGTYLEIGCLHLWKI